MTKCIFCNFIDVLSFQSNDVRTSVSIDAYFKHLWRVITSTPMKISFLFTGYSERTRNDNGYIISLLQTPLKFLCPRVTEMYTNYVTSKSYGFSPVSMSTLNHRCTYAGQEHPKTSKHK